MGRLTENGWVKDALRPSVILNFAIAAIVMGGFFVAWYYQTQALAQDQHRQDAKIASNETGMKVNERDINDGKIQFRGLQSRVNTQFDAIQRNQDDINRKLDRLLDIQLRGARAR